MKKLILIIWITFFGITAGQNLTVLKTDGSDEKYNIAEIDSVTFTQVDAGIMIDLLYVHTTGGAWEFAIPEIDSIYFNSDSSITLIQTLAGLSSFAIADIDSITFGTAPTDESIYITYNGNSAEVINPYENLGVTIDVAGADVIVTAEADISSLNYILSGGSQDGMFKIYSDKKLVLNLNELELTNLDGPAINIQAGKEIIVNLVDGTENSLSDGATYAAPVNDEDQDAAFFSEGQLIFEGEGLLEINGNGEDQHGLGSDDYIEINSGTVVINSAEKDGIHVNDGFFMNGGTVEITSDSDGIDAGEGAVEITDGFLTIDNSDDDKGAVKTDSTIVISGGEIYITVSGDQSKGLNSDQDITISGGALTIVTSGGVVLEESGSGFDPSYCTAIKADGNLTIAQCDLSITTTGEAGRGISIDGNLFINSGNIEITSSGSGDTYTNEDGENDAYHGPCIKADGDVEISGGVITLAHSGDAGKALSVDGMFNYAYGNGTPQLEIVTTGDEVVITPGGWGSSGDYAEAKAISADGVIHIEGGIMNISSADDGIKSKDSLIINNGTIVITDSYEGLESPNLFINGGDLSITASDDAINSTYGVDGEFNDGSQLNVNGGYIHVSATGGDALDGNGDIYINGGVMVVHGPQSSPEVGLDVNGDCQVTGGFIVISGTNSFMTEGPSSSSTQQSVLLRSNQSNSAGTLFHIEDSAGNTLVTFAPERSYYSMIFSSDQLAQGTSYKVYTGGTCTGELKDGLYTGGTYSGGTLRTTFTLSNIAPTVWF